MAGEEADRRFMAAAIRLSRRNLGRTATNPSVATLIVRDSVIIGRGVTAVGGRPHAETEALAEAGEGARGATAYVTLEPCAHHGRTPPCAEALVRSGVTRIVGAANDPDHRVSGKGYAILRAAGIEVVEGVLAAEAADLMAGYLTRSVSKRPEVTLKLAISTDGALGRRGEGSVRITGDIASAQVHMMRAEADAIMIGIGTALADDPLLTCRLPGLEARSPIRIVLDQAGRLPLDSRLVRSARDVPLMVAVDAAADPARTEALAAAGVTVLATEQHEGRIALPELMEDLAARGIMTVMAEGGATLAASLNADDLVDRLALLQGNVELGGDLVASPIALDAAPAGFAEIRSARFGSDRYRELIRRR